MKRILAALLCTVLAINANASLLPAGTSELGLSGGVDFDSPSGTQIDFSTFYGYFVDDYFEVGLKLDLYNDDDYTAWAIGPKVEQNYDIGIELAPYVGASLMYATIDGPAGGGGDKSALVFGVEGGAKYFITEYFAVSGALVLELATDKIYPSDGEMKKHDIRLEFGVRTFF